jgi:hypothetical protein|tara:strand:- start:780 stop:914 length:135 start_codon:yes stop_codon:yes gene_type:complete
MKKGWSNYEAKVNAMQAYKSTMALYGYHGKTGLSLWAANFDIYG